VFATNDSALNDAFNYIAVLVSIITGLAATRLMSGMSEMIQAANRPRVYWVHTMWIISLFIDLMLYWWLLYRWRTAPNWTFFLFVWVTIPAILVYLASAVLFPGELETTGSPTWRDYYYKNRRGFFFIFGISAPLDIIDTLLKGRQHFIDQGPAYLPFIAIWGAGCLAAGITKNEKYHGFWAIAFPAMMILYIAKVLLQLG
jgi:hypothetical protein